MILNNISNKVISVGKHAIMPGETLEVTKEVAESKVIRALVAKGLLEVKDVPKAVEEETAEAPKKTRKAKAE